MKKVFNVQNYFFSDEAQTTKMALMCILRHTFNFQFFVKTKVPPKGGKNTKAAVKQSVCISGGTKGAYALYLVGTFSVTPELCFRCGHSGASCLSMFSMYISLHPYIFNFRSQKFYYCLFLLS